MKLIKDIAWAYTMFKIKRHREKLLFTERRRFDVKIRPKFDDDHRLNYPDAFYVITSKDFKEVL